MKSEIAVTRRTTYRAEENVVNLEKSKKKQDLLIDTMNEEICFKCNKVGHLAINCVETNIIKCNRCGLNGHKEIRCLKVWRGGVEYS